MNGRRRGRDEYERDQNSLPGGPTSSFYHHRAEQKRPATLAMRGDERDRGAAPSSDDDWRAGMSSAEKKEEFIRLMKEAWDLFHS